MHNFSIAVKLDTYVNNHVTRSFSCSMPDEIRIFELLLKFQFLFFGAFLSLTFYARDCGPECIFILVNARVKWDLSNMKNPSDRFVEMNYYYLDVSQSFTYCNEMNKCHDGVSAALWSQ